MTFLDDVDDLDVYGVADPPDAPPATPVADPLAGTPRLPVMVRPSSPASFFRMVAAPPTRVAAWLSARGEVELEHRLRLGAPHDEGGGAVSIAGALRRSAGRRWIPVQIVLCPHVGSVSKLTLDPARRVRSSRGWFRSGHRALDRLAREVLAS